MIFSDNSIPEATRTAVGNLASRRRLPQSVMLTGGSEKLRKDSAREIISAVLCSADSGVPCGKCPNCFKVKKGVHPDVIVIEPTKGRKKLSVEQIRNEVRDTMYLAPNEAENKVYYFPEVDESLSDIVQNALLKSIEEPPDFVMFLFTSVRRECFLSTVISRTVEYSLGDINTAASKKKDEKITEILSGIIRAMLGGTEYDIMMSLAPMNKDRDIMKRVAVKLNETARDAAAEQAGARLLSDNETLAINMASRLSVRQILMLKETADRIISLADGYANANLMITQFSMMLQNVINAK